MNQVLRDKLTTLFFKYVEVASPEICLKSFKNVDIKGKTLLVGVGKASIPYCEKIQDKIKSQYEGIIISTKIKNVSENLNNFKIFFAGHPVPNKNGLEASQYLIEKVDKLEKNDLLIFLVSGGGSSLLPSPPEGFNLKDEINLNKKLLYSGMNIKEINLVRKHFSMIKGGRLARLAYPSKVKTYVVSDIPGDDLSQVSSGPTLPSTGKPMDAIHCIEKHKVILPKKILNHIKKNNDDIPCKTDIMFKNNSAYLLASAKKSMNATSNFAKLMDLEVIVISDQSQGHATQVAKEHASFIKSYIEKIKFKKSKKIFCFISGGETSVKVMNKNGKGGRNTEYLLSLAIELELLRVKSFVAIAADTDGIDGTEDNAGAIIDENTLFKIRNKNLSPDKLLIENNSYCAFKSSGELFITGPTGTNVNDFRAILIKDH